MLSAQPGTGTPLLRQAGSKPLNELRARAHLGTVIARCPFALLIATLLQHIQYWHSRKSKSSSLRPQAGRCADTHARPSAPRAGTDLPRFSAGLMAAEPPTPRRCLWSGWASGGLRASPCSLHSGCLRTGAGALSPGAPAWTACAAVRDLLQQFFSQVCSGQGRASADPAQHKLG